MARLFCVFLSFGNSYCKEIFFTNRGSSGLPNGILLISVGRLEAEKKIVKVLQNQTLTIRNSAVYEYFCSPNGSK
jgi:hypothetical protein